MWIALKSTCSRITCHEQRVSLLRFASLFFPASDSYTRIARVWIFNWASSSSANQKMNSSKMDTKPNPMEVTIQGNVPQPNSAFPKSRPPILSAESVAVKNALGASSSQYVNIPNESANNELASLFECPVCFEYVLPPILQCQNGHLVISESDKLSNRNFV